MTSRTITFGRFREIKPLLPFYKSIKTMPTEERLEFGLIMRDGKTNKYRTAFIEGVGASIKDRTWNRKKHQHSCCGSKVPWRHLINCSKAVRNAPDDLSDLKDLC